MKRWWILKGLKMAFFFLLFGTLMTYVLMMLWNWLMPAIFGLGMITFWQALGIFILAKLVFGFGRGGWGHHYGGHHWKHQVPPVWKEKMEEKLKNMSPEERDKFRQEWRTRCGRWGHNPFDEEKKDEPDVKTN